MTDVIIPIAQWGEEIEGSITTWYFDSGDAVSCGDVLVDIMVEKVQYELESPATGKLIISLKEGELVKAGDVVAEIAGDSSVAIGVEG